MLSAWMVCIFLRLFHRFVVVSKIGDVAEVQSWHNQSRIRKNLHFKGFFFKALPFQGVAKEVWAFNFVFNFLHARKRKKKRIISLWIFDE